jgi:alkylhydroperoxidase family enzyme
MSRVSLSDVGSTPYERTMGHAPHVLESWSRLEEAFFRRSILPAQLLEQVRRTLALGHGCAYCQAKSGPPDKHQAEFKTSLAVGLAQVFATDHREVDERMLQAMRAHFSEPELVELVAFMSFMWAGGTFGSVLGIQATESYEPRTSSSGPVAA